MIPYAYPRLSTSAIQTALDYYHTYQEEIDRMITENEQVIESPE